MKSISKYVTQRAGKVTHITTGAIGLESGEEFPYESLISTIPAPDFWKMYGPTKRFRWLPVTYAYSPTPPFGASEKNWDLLYLVDNEPPYTRVNYNKDTNNYLYEFTGEIQIKEIQQLCPGMEVSYHHIDRYGVIRSKAENRPPNRVQFVGRFATWNHDYRIQDSLDAAIALANEKFYDAIVPEMG
jgi:hypothetical protein